MKKTISAIAACMMSGLMLAQTDPVIMTVAGKQVQRSEFEYSFKKNNSDGVIDRKTVEEYVPLFVNFKLKVAAAEEARYDTLTSMRNDLQSYREEMLLPTLSDPDYVETMARKVYDNTAARFGGDDILEASHILVLMRQDATTEQQVAAKTRLHLRGTVCRSRLCTDGTEMLRRQGIGSQRRQPRTVWQGHDDSRL